MRSDFFKGMTHGIPIALGYISVSFGFGIAAVRAGLSVAAAVGISASNLTSAGQAAGVEIIAAGGTLIELALSQLVINLRYSLMGLSLSQKLDDSFTVPHRLLASYGITDEIFAVAAAQPGKLKPSYMYGLILISALGWTGGTLLGAVAGQALPQMFTAAMGILLYGMFIAIIIPPSRKSRSVFGAVLIAALISLLFKFVFTKISVGFAIIISASVAAAVMALIAPVPDDEEEEQS